jgi:hypothetical protein
MSSVFPRALMGAFALVASAAASVSPSTPPLPAPELHEPMLGAFLMDGGVSDSPDAALVVVARGEAR